MWLHRLRDGQMKEERRGLVELMAVSSVKYPSEMHSRGEAQGCDARGTCDLSWGGGGEEQMSTG